MPQRKPPTDAWDSWIEAQIRTAMDDGAFANLPHAVARILMRAFAVPEKIPLQQPPEPSNLTSC